MSWFAPQNPGIGGLDELTSSEETTLGELADITHAKGKIIVSNGIIWSSLTVGSDNQVLTADSAEAVGVKWATGGGSAPTDATYVTLSTNGSLSQERVLTGTTNQITITDGGANGNVTLSTPQNLHSTASVRFGTVTINGSGLTLAGTTNISSFGSTFVNLANAAAARTNLGLVIGTDVQAWDNDLDDLAALAHSGSAMIVSNGTDWLARTPAQVRTDLGLVIGTNVQAWDNDLDDLAALSHSGSAMIVSNGTDWLARTPAQVRTDLGLVIGTNVQAWDNDLDDLAALTHSGSAFIVSNGTDWLSRTQSQAINDLGGTATAAQINTGTNATSFIVPDAFAASNFGVRVVGIQVTGTATAMSLGDGVAIFRIPSVMNGMNLTGVAAQVYTAGTTNVAQIQIRNKTDAVDMLSTKLFIDSAEVDSSTAATAYVINTDADDVATGDLIAVDIDAVHGSAASGLVVELSFQLP